MIPAVEGFPDLLVSAADRFLDPLVDVRPIAAPIQADELADMNGQLGNALGGHLIAGVQLLLEEGLHLLDEVLLFKAVRFIQARDHPR